MLPSLTEYLRRVNAIRVNELDQAGRDYAAEKMSAGDYEFLREVINADWDERVFRHAWFACRDLMLAAACPTRLRMMPMAHIAAREGQFWPGRRWPRQQVLL